MPEATVAQTRPSSSRLTPEARAAARRAWLAILRQKAPRSRLGFAPVGSDIAYANRNETKHLPYGAGTLRAEPLAEALARFERPATVISEAPDEGSSQAIRAVLTGEPPIPVA